MSSRRRVVVDGGPLDGAAAVRELTGRTSEETARRKVGVLHWRSFALTIGCGAQGPNEGATTVIEHVTCTACLSAYTHNDYPAAALPTVADVEHDGDRGPRASTDQALGPKRSKPFPMPGTVWRWLGHPDYDPKPSAPKRVESLRWFRGRVEAMFVGGESCAGVEHLMGSDAWEHYPETVPVGRDPISVLDQAADAQRAAHVGALLSAVAGLHVDEVRVLAWVAWQLPGRKLRRKCEEATATGWCRTEDPKPTARSTPEDRARAALLAAWRQVVALVHGAQSTAARDVAQRDRGDVLADEAARRAGGGE